MTIAVARNERLDNAEGTDLLDRILTKCGGWIFSNSKEPTLKANSFLSLQVASFIGRLALAFRIDFLHDLTFLPLLMIIPAILLLHLEPFL